jgi:phage terminase large subunit-like protein
MWAFSATAPSEPHVPQSLAAFPTGLYDDAVDSTNPGFPALTPITGNEVDFSS